MNIIQNNIPGESQAESSNTKSSSLFWKNRKVIAVGIIMVLTTIALIVLNIRAESPKLTGQETSEVRPFSIAMNEWEPHAYSDEDGVAHGISVEVVDRIFSRLGVSYEIHFVPWPRVLKEIESGEADASLTTSYTDERAEFLYYVEEGLDYTNKPYPPYFVTVADTVFFVRKKIEASIKFDTLQEIVEKGYRVGVISGFYSTGKLYETGIDNEKVIEYFNLESGIQGLVDGEVDTFLQEKAVGFTFLKKMNLTEKIIILPQSFFANPQYVAFSKQSDYPDLLEFRERFLDELQKMHESGEYDEIYNSYIE